MVVALGAVIRQEFLKEEMEIRVGIEELWLPNTTRGPAVIFQMEALLPLHALNACSLFL